MAFSDSGGDSNDSTGSTRACSSMFSTFTILVAMTGAGKNEMPRSTDSEVACLIPFVI